MSAELLLSRLDKVKQTGPGRWIACSPTRKERTPSLSIRELDDGRILIHDFGGEAPADVLAAVGLEFKDLFPEALSPHMPRERRPLRIRDAIAALEHELVLALIILAAVSEGREVTDRARAGECRARIIKFITELRHAA